MKSYDIVIVGGGLVGTTLAISLQYSPWRVALIEAYLPKQHQQATEDMRSLALTDTSQKILDTLQIWQNIAALATPIKKIHVSEAKRFGKTVLDSQELGLRDFGYVIPIPYLYQALQKELERTDMPGDDKKNNTHRIELIRPATVKLIERKDNFWELDVHSDIGAQSIIEKIQTTLVIAADGDRSFIRESLYLPIEKTDYHQTAIVTTALTSLGHNNTAYERFTSKGVLATLPLQKNRVAVIWTVPDEQAENIKNNLLAETQSAMGYRLGKFSDLGNIQTYPLKEIQAETQTLPGLFLLGNAAHVLHPIAAQGLNLSLRDAVILGSLLQKKSDLNNPEISKIYLDTRKADQEQTEQFTDRLVKLFTPQFLPISILRSLGLLAFDLFPSAKRKFCLKRMGNT